MFLNAFYIDKYEVTNFQYKQFIDATGRATPAYWNDEKYNQPNQPVVGITWHDAVAYAKWAGKRLPTEAEWEKAARGIDGRRYPWGNEWDSLKCNSDIGGDGYQYTAPVGSFPAGVSPYGVMDMIGNVWEYTSDWYSEDYYSVSPYKNPTGPETGTNRVMKPSGWRNLWDVVRLANRNGYFSPDIAACDQGFRCAKSP